MSQDFMDSEIFADFIIEAKEHLETIEPNLLKLEKLPNNAALLNDIFRPMHSLKGASGFLGLNKINRLAHKCENILDELRKETMVMTSEIMDVILSATDTLGQIIENLNTDNSEGDVEIEHLADQIDAIMAYYLEGKSLPVIETQTETPSIDIIVEDEIDSEIEMNSEDEISSVNENKPSSSKNNVTPKIWIESLTIIDSYKLTAFGEGHLKDFIDESYEIIENLNAGLISLEELSDIDPDLVNDLFRYFHNLKGNSSIIGFSQLNALTHEAETLLNNIRRGEDKVTHELIDLLLFVTDVMESLIHSIDTTSCSAKPFIVDELIEKLQDAVAGKSFDLPGGNIIIEEEEEEEIIIIKPLSSNAKEEESVPANKPNKDTVLPVIITAGLDEDDIDIFRSTVNQQFEFIKVAFINLDSDSNDKSSIDALYRCLIAIKNSCSFLKFDEIKECAERTASIVDGARKKDIDFGIVLSILTQECDIIKDMISDAINKATQAINSTPDAQEVATATKAEKIIPVAKVEKTVPVTKAQKTVPVSKAQKEESTKAKKVDRKLPQTLRPPVIADAIDKSPVKTMPVADAKGQDKSNATTSVKSKATAQADTGGNKGSSTIRVDHERLDHLMNLIGELIINRNRYSLIARHLEEEENVDVAQVAQSLSETTYAMARISDDLQDTIMKVRMVPVASVFSRFPRLVRDLSRKSGKEVDLILEGEETELDKSVVEVIGDPLVHLIRNSMDHGIEDEDTRASRGKPAKGRVVLRAYHRGNSVAIEIEDDGKGIDPEKMREVAIKKGLLDAESARQLDDREAMELIFAPGFSSAETITDISGRGVGMDVVRTNIKNLKGRVTIASEVGKGTKFTLILPLTLAIIDALMVNVAGNLYALPLDAVSETTKIEAARLTDVKGRKAVTLRGEVIGIIELAEILCLPRKPLPDLLAVVVIHDGSRRLGLVVDRLLERQEIVIKPLGSYLGDLRGISGATIMGDGSVILILDPHEIYMLSNSKNIS